MEKAGENYPVLFSGTKSQEEHLAHHIQIQHQQPLHNQPQSMLSNATPAVTEPEEHQDPDPS